MSHESSNYIRLHITAHLLSAEVPVELSILATEEVRLVLVVVLFQVANQSRSHVSVVRARSD